MNVLVVLALLAGASVASVASGQLRVAVALAACKAMLVGVEFMELRHAARIHLAGYAAVVVLAAGASLL